jgi:hypothetical protein
VTTQEALKWVEKNCTDEAVSRLRSRRVALTLAMTLFKACRIIRDEYPEEDDRYQFAVAIIGEEE